MIIKTFQNYISKSFLLSFIKTVSIFVGLAFILNIFEEINFFKDLNVSISIPVFLTILNIPSIIFEIFPFIFLITTQFFFIKLIEQNENIAFKNFGLSNTRIIKLLAILSFLIGLLIVTIFYNLSSNLKHSYLNIKNSYAKDNKYLAVITENGIWIKDEKEGVTNIINAEVLKGDYLQNVDIVQFDKNFNFIKNITSKKTLIKNKIWIIEEAIVNTESKSNIKVDTLELVTNIDSNDVNSLFSNLTSLSIIELANLKKKYEDINYSSIEVNSAIQKIASFPFYLMIMTILASTIMMNIKQNRSKIFHLIFGILISVIIYYISFFFEELGKNEQVPVFVSIWVPLLMISIASIISLVRINEK
ncbi:LptF/LptG family permease [Candidatus Pelagibacter communis]|uniref:LptF/LptG family permease n=1 Tax=Pelagibacter ubique TaxID=198252 RepID=UPI0009E5A16C|nr:LptF/LptG family permease [Candidatus Pelagibacter ubique]